MTDAAEHAGAKAKALELVRALFRRGAYPMELVVETEAKAAAFLEVLIEVCAGEAERRAAPWIAEQERTAEALTRADLELQEQLATARAQADSAKEAADGLRSQVTELLGRVAELEAAHAR